MDAREIFEATGPIWQWRPAKPEAASWYFLTVDAQTAAEIRYAALGRIASFGSIRVTATIGGTTWQTSLFPHKESGGLLLPLKAEVRRREGLVPGNDATVRIEV